MIRFDPPVPRFRFAVAALFMSALTVSLMVALPSELEQESQALAVRADTRRVAAAPRAAGALLRCTIPAAFNAPLFLVARAAVPDPLCMHNS